MSHKITNKHIIEIKELISDEVCMGTYGLVELELIEMEECLKSTPIPETLTRYEETGLGVQMHPHGDYVLYKDVLGLIKKE